MEGILLFPATCSWPGNLPWAMGKDGRERGEAIPSDAMYFGYLAWFEDGVGYAAKGCPDIEGDDERARRPGVGLAHVRGGLDHGSR